MQPPPTRRNEKETLPKCEEKRDENELFNDSSINMTLFTLGQFILS